MVLCCAEDAMLFGVNRFDSFTPSPVQVLPCTWLVYWTVIFSLQGWMKDKEPYKLKWAVVSHPFFFPFYDLSLSFSKIKREEKISMRMHKQQYLKKWYATYKHWTHMAHVGGVTLFRITLICW